MPEAEILVLSCIDLRIVNNLKKNLDNLGYQNKYDFVSIAGSSLSLGIDTKTLNSENKEMIQRWRKTILDQIDISIDIHNLKEVWLIDHQDCGAYKKLLPETCQDNEKSIHYQHLHNSFIFLKDRYPKLKIKIMYEYLNGDLLYFHKDKEILLKNGEIDFDIYKDKYVKYITKRQKSPYHHGEDGLFRNPKGTPDMHDDITPWSFWKFYKGKNKLLSNGFPQSHVISSQEALIQLKEINQGITWLGHATFLIRLEGINILTDPILTNKSGPIIFGAKRYAEMPIEIKDLPKIDLILITHTHYDHLDLPTLEKIVEKNKDVHIITPLKVESYLESINNVKIKELDWYKNTEFDKFKITLLPAIHWSRRSVFDLNKSLWGSFLMEIGNKKILFCCDTGYDKFYEELGKKYGPIDLIFVNIGAYNFEGIFEKSDYHTNPEQAVQICRDMKSKKIIGMHWGTFVLSFEPILEPRERFLKEAKKYEDIEAIDFKIGETKDISLE
ncbi:Beta-lactamase superfamily domain [seawater metagenome]|uniref:Beta-lactamase superfamily domain n=1 Tax=seawater metagenome TaxID=1561972 RepID=A0A5E8CKL7_9ZZZZ